MYNNKYRNIPNIKFILIELVSLNFYPVLVTDASKMILYIYMHAK